MCNFLLFAFVSSYEDEVIKLIILIKQFINKSNGFRKNNNNK